jgi:hypothetical protein
LIRIEAEVKQLDTEIAAEEKQARRAALFGSSALGGPALGTVVNDSDPARTAGFRSLAEFAVAVRNFQVAGIADPRITGAASGYQQNQGTSGEGVLVPTEWRDQIWALVFADNDLLGFCNPEPTQGNTVGIVKDETTPWGAAGVQAAWRSEGTSMIASKAALTPTILQLHELYAFVLATNEVLDDAPRLQNRITIQAARAIRWKLFEAVCFGDGNGKPLGFMKSPALVTVAAEGRTDGRHNRHREYPEDDGAAVRDAWRQPDVARQSRHYPAARHHDDRQQRRVPADQPGADRLAQELPARRSGAVQRARQTFSTLGDIVLADMKGYALATKSAGASTSHPRFICSSTTT